jgi:hypothetical protein
MRAHPPPGKVTTMIFAALRLVRGKPGGRQSTLAALGAAVGVAIAGAVVWGLVALLIHRQLSLLGLVIGVGVGLVVARFRPGHWPTIVTGAVIAVAGCALGTLLGQVFLLLSAQVSLSVILGHLNLLFRAYPSNVGALGLLFYALAAYGAIRVPLQSQRRQSRMPSSSQPSGGMPVVTPAAMTGPTDAPADPGPAAMPGAEPASGGW